MMLFIFVFLFSAYVIFKGNYLQSLWFERDHTCLDLFFICSVRRGDLFDERLS